jgi:hypothetical protein
MDVQAFIVEVVNEYLSYNYYYDNIVDLLDATLDDYVTNNTVDDNKKIIETYATDVFNALNLYNKYLGDTEALHNSTRDYFYQQLAYVSLFVKIYPQISQTCECECEYGSSFNNDDVADIFIEMVDVYNAHYELGVSV